MLLNFEHLKTFYSALRQKMKNFRGNWEQNDPSADDYIKNRPFYEKIRSVVTVNPKAELDFSYANTCDWGQTKQGFIHEGLGEFEFAIKLDTSYTVVFDGKEYNLFAVQEDQYSNIILGNGAFVGDANKDNGLPFVIGNYSLGNEHTYIIVGDNRRHSFEVKIVDRDLKKLDKKYLPDDLTEGFADVAKTGSYNDLIDTPEIPDVSDVIRYNSQSLTSEQKEIARANIGAGTSNFSGEYDDLTNTPSNLMSYHELDWLDSRYSPYSACGYYGDLVVLSSYGGNNRLSYSSTNGANWNHISTNSAICSIANCMLKGYYDDPSGIVTNVQRSIFIGVSKNNFMYYYGDGKFKTMDPPVQAPVDSAWCSICSGNISDSYTTTTYRTVAISGLPNAYVSLSSENAARYASSVAACCTLVHITDNEEDYEYFWGEVSMPVAAPWTKVAFGNSKFVAVSKGTNAAYSSDGQNWTAAVLPADATWNELVYNPSAKTFVAVSLEGHTAYSTDGINWTAHTEQTGKPFVGPIEYINGRLVSFSYTNDEEYCKCSDDGINWFINPVPLPITGKWRMLVHPSVSALVCFPVVSTFHTKILISNDGINWQYTVLTVDNEMRNDRVAKVLTPLIMTDENIPDTIARVSDVSTQNDALLQEAQAYTDSAIVQAETDIKAYIDQAILGGEW